jgi:hypothetical protein
MDIFDLLRKTIKKVETEVERSNQMKYRPPDMLLTVFGVVLR